MRIDFSIWGIRVGFEPGGFLHSHSYADVLDLQKDRYRNLGNAIGGQGFYLLHRLNAYFVCSFIDTSVHEFVTNGSPRPGYVAFSIIIPSTHVFAASPRRVLNLLASFYNERVGETQYNNFTAEEISQILSELQVVPSSHYLSSDYSSAYAYYEQASELDDILTGNMSYSRFGELTLIPSNKDYNTGRFQEINFIDPLNQPTPRYVDLTAAKNASIQDREMEIARQRQEVEENRNRDAWKAEAKKVDDQLYSLIKKDQLEEARNLVNEYSPEQRQYLSSLKVLEDRESKIRDSERKESIASQILLYFNSGDIESAHGIWKQSSQVDKLLSEDIIQMIRSHDAKLKKEKERFDEKLRKEEERKKIVRYSLFAFSIAVILGISIYFGLNIFEQEKEIARQSETQIIPNAALDSVEYDKDSIGREQVIPPDQDQPESDKDILAKGEVVEINSSTPSADKITEWRKISEWNRGYKFFRLNNAKDGYLWSNQKENLKRFEPVNQMAHNALNNYLEFNFIFKQPSIKVKEKPKAVKKSKEEKINSKNPMSEIDGYKPEKNK
jgi:hypothetical protein